MNQFPSSSHHCPILSRRMIGRFENPTLRPHPQARVAHVLVTAAGDVIPLSSVGRPDGPTRGKLFWTGSATLYEIDLGRHHTTITFDLPAAGDAFRFSIEIDIEWRVSEPKQVVLDAVSDVRVALTPVLRQILGDVTRRHHITEAHSAEYFGQQAVNEQVPGARYGLDCRMFVRMKTDDGSVSHAKSMQEVENEIALEERRQWLRILQEDNRESLIRKRTAVYREFIEAGTPFQAALQLAQNPDDIQAVMRMLKDERDAYREQATDFFAKVLESGALERHDLHDHARVILEWLRERTDQIITAPATQSASIPRQGAPSPRPRIPEPLPNPPVSGPPLDPAP